MRSAPEAVREVGVHDFWMGAKQQLLQLYGGLLGIAPSTVGVDFRWKVGFEDRLQHQHRCCHADPIPHGRDAQRPEFALAFGMNTRLIGSGRYVSFLSANASSASHRSTPYASMSAKSWPSTPGAPLFERHWA